MEYKEIDDIKILIERKNIKNIYIRVLPPDGNVKVTAPKRASNDAIRTFVMSKLNWIKKHKAEIEQIPRQKELKYFSGEPHYLWGNAYTLEVVYSNGGSDVSIQGDKIVLKTVEDSSFEQREKLMIEWYRKLLKDAIPNLLEKCIKIVGKAPNEWHVKNMKTRWGTCNTKKKRIWLNLQLAKKPPECLEYVIIHELAHLYVASHNAEFKAYMDRFYPDWKEVKKKLR